MTFGWSYGPSVLIDQAALPATRPASQENLQVSCLCAVLEPHRRDHIHWPPAESFASYAQASRPIAALTCATTCCWEVAPVPKSAPTYGRIHTYCWLVADWPDGVIVVLARGTRLRLSWRGSPARGAYPGQQGSVDCV
jgi:hypothetical protein